jgi:hypothetical protein
VLSASVAAYAAPRNTVPASAVSPQRLEALSRAYLGTPYRLDCLGEGQGPDADPLYTRKQVDCQTLVEQVMAEAIAPWVGGRHAAVRSVRYRHSEIALENRFHFCVPDWLVNPWPVQDATVDVGGGEVANVRRRIDLPALLAARGVSGARSPVKAATVTTPYIPRARVATLQSRIPDGTVVLFVEESPEVVAGHMGFLFRRQGTLVLRHASQTRHRVIDEPLAVYLARAPRRFIGLKVLKPDVSGLYRAGS